MSSGGKGWIGSVAVHLGVVVAIVGFSWYAARHGGESIEAVDPILVDLNGIPGKRPGEIGKAPGVAKGSETGSKSGVPIIHLKKLDVEKTLQNRAKAEQAEQAAQASPKSSKSVTKVSSKNGTSGNNPKKMTLGEFNNSKGVGKSGSSSKVGGIGGATVKKGRSYGEGDNGGEGGSASEKELYAGVVQDRLLAAWTQLLSAEGSTIASVGSCGVTVSIDASGFASFSGWLTKPGDTRMAELVKRACGMIGNCGKPPAGKTFKIDFTKISAIDG
jgi:hypothetical protein